MLATDAKAAEQAARDLASAQSAKDKPAAATELRKMQMALSTLGALILQTTVDTAWLVDRDFRRRLGAVPVLASALIAYTWPADLEVIVDAETADNPCAPVVSVEGGVHRERPELAHAFCEADGALWHLPHRLGQGGVIHSTDADTVDWGLNTLLLEHVQGLAGLRRQYHVRYRALSKRAVDMNALWLALAEGRPSTCAGAGCPVCH